MRGWARFQINFRLKPFSFVPGLNDFKPVLLPYLWFEEVLIDYNEGKYFSGVKSSQIGRDSGA